jgi:hypothetical protein
MWRPPSRRMRLHRTVCTLHLEALDRRAPDMKQCECGGLGWHLPHWHSGLFLMQSERMGRRETPANTNPLSSTFTSAVRRGAEQHCHKMEGSWMPTQTSPPTGQGPPSRGAGTLVVDASDGDRPILLSVLHVASHWARQVSSVQPRSFYLPVLTFPCQTTLPCC